MIAAPNLVLVRENSCGVLLVREMASSKEFHSYILAGSDYISCRIKDESLAWTINKEKFIDVSPLFPVNISMSDPITLTLHDYNEQAEVPTCPHTAELN
jgi:hypothetical protein